MLQQNRTTSNNPERLLETSLKAVVTQASREKLLPKIMWRVDREFGSRKLLNYQKSVHRQYDFDLKNPLKYDPEVAKSEREKFREKVGKLVNNQLDVEYFQNVKVKDKTLVTYNGHEMEEEKVQTKKQFLIFKNFNESRFKQTYSNLFDDKLELGYDNLYHNRAAKRCHTLHVLESKTHIDQPSLRTEESQSNIKVRRIDTGFTVPNTERKKQGAVVVDSGRKKVAMINFNERKIVGKELLQNEEAEIIRTMRLIGGHSNAFEPTSLSLTRESINQWLKQEYEKPIRLVDFLQIKSVVEFDEFWRISKRLRVMPQDHILFMTFLYYDGNNDGYICDYDMERMANLSLRRPVIAHDHKKIRQSNIKKVLTKNEAYLDLYKRSQISETAYFDWKSQHEVSQAAEFGLQMKNRLLRSKQKQIFLDFAAFSSIYKFEKPFLWYDLMQLFSGVSFQGLRYER